MDNLSFSAFELTNGLIYEAENFQVYGLTGRTVMTLGDGTWMVYVHEGEVYADDYWPIGERMYGSLIGLKVSSTRRKTRAVLVRFRNYLGQPMVGGPIEPVGRLRYIDGCSDSLLVAPVHKGDPCLNHLHFPEQTNQTPHTHPDHRIGFVAGGRGECITPYGNTDLHEGMVFIIHPGSADSGDVGVHSFRTGMRKMDVIAWHPSTEYGPTDEIHPMIVGTKTRKKNADANA